MGDNFSTDYPFCDQLVRPFLPFLCGKWKYLYNLEDNLEALQKEMQDLHTMRNDLLKRVSYEKDRGLQVLQEVNGWNLMVKEIEQKANGLLDKSVSEIRKLSMHGYCSGNSDYSEDVVTTLKKVIALRSEGDFEVVVDRALPPRLIKRPPIQLTVSQENLLETAWNSLMDEKVGTLGICGVGGVGKTTLLTQIKNKIIEAGDAFDLVIFVVVVSQEVESIQDAISKRLCLVWGRETKEEKAAEILTILKKKRFVVLLDGIQREVDLEEIGLPVPSRENGCKIVFTTRSRQACETKWVDAKVEVQCLSPDEAWDLFQNTVSEKTLSSHPEIPKLARIVASTCRGLPLALDLIGETMARKRTVSEWRYTIHLLASSAAEFPDTEYEFLPILKCIYDSLPDEKVRLCFLYCALFPKDCDMRKEDLVDYWIGEGIISKEDREIAEIEGYDLIGDLVRMCMLMEDESRCCVKMHGMVREMALWIASDYGRQKELFVAVGGESIHEMPKVKNWRRVTRMSVTSSLIEDISYSPNCSELTTLFLQGNSKLKSIPDDFFQWMPSLVVLNLSRNKELVELPEQVSSLLSLKFLNLSFTLIKKLPIGLKELTRLIHLDLDNTHELLDISVIASLLNLQVLRLFRSVTMDRSLIEDITLLKSLTELSLSVEEDVVLDLLLSIQRLARCIRRLSLKGVTIKDGGISMLNALFSLRKLHIEDCDITEITIGRRNNTIQRVASCFGNVEKIAQLRNIRTVYLDRCNGLKDLTWLLLAPSLDDLRISECLQIQEITSREKAGDLSYTSEQVFQNLTRLSLNGLPQLESIYWSPLPFPVMKFLEIRGCPNLRRLPFNSESAEGKNVRIKLDSSCGEEVFKKLDEVETLLPAGNFQVITEPGLSPVVEEEPIQQQIMPWTRSLVSCIAHFLIDSCALSCLADKVDYMYDLKESLGTLRSAMDELRADRDVIINRVEDGQLKGGEQLDIVNKWLLEVQTIETDTFHLIDEASSQDASSVHQRPSTSRYWSIDSISTRFIGQKVLKKLEEVRVLSLEGKFEVMTVQPLPMVQRRHFDQTFGLDTTLEKTWKSLMDSENRILGIYGMGGVGKTTLLTLINNKFDEVKYKFDIVIWVKVSDGVDIGKIQDVIAKRLGIYDEKWGSLSQREKAVDIGRVLTFDRPRFVLLFDDLWKELSLLAIGIPMGKNFKVVFTTRSMYVCGRMGVHDSIQVQCLAEEDAWDLFKLKARYGWINDEISVIAKKIAGKCCGLPLALEVIGKSMAYKTTVHEWHHALSILESSPDKLEGMEEELYGVLKLSYDNLKDDNAKLCFQYCALFPKAYQIKKEELVEYWIAEGILDEKYGRQKTRDHGYHIISTLVNASLLLEDDEFNQNVSMHNMIRDMAYWIVSKFEHKERFVVKTDAGLSQRPDVTDWKTATKMSLINNEIESIPDDPEFRGQARLTTLFLQNNRLVGIVGSFFVAMSALVVLDLSRNPWLTELPGEISNLVSLRYLSLLGTRIKVLPNGLKDLTKLIHLNLESTSNLQSISLVSELLKLQVLRFYESAAALDLSLMEELERFEDLELLTITVGEIDVLEALLRSKLARCTQGLFLQGLDEVSGKSFSATFDGILVRLSKLEMIDCNITEMETEWEDTRRNQYPPSTSSHQFTPKSPWFNLSSVVLLSCEHLRDVTWLIYAANLQSLSITLSPKLEEVISQKKDVGVGVEPFQNLQVLDLNYLPELKSIYPSPLSFPTLRRVSITKCTKLHMLPLNSTSVDIIDNLRIEVEEEWLKEIIWENGAKERFLPAIHKV